MKEDKYNKGYAKLIAITPQSRSDWNDVYEDSRMLLGRSTLPTESYKIWKNASYDGFRGGIWSDLSLFLEASYDLTRQNILALLYHSEQTDSQSKPTLKSIIEGDKDGDVIGAACLALSRFPEEIGYLTEMTFKLTKTVAKIGAFIGASQILGERGGSFYTKALEGGKQFPVSLQPLAFSLLKDSNAQCNTRVVSNYAQRIIGDVSGIPNSITDVVAYLYHNFDGYRTMDVFSKLENSWTSLNYTTQMYLKKQYDYFDSMPLSDIPSADDLISLDNVLKIYSIPISTPIFQRWRNMQADISIKQQAQIND